MCKKPNWLKVRCSTSSKRYDDISNALISNNLKTVCEESACPNVRYCWNKGHAAFMILGNICTRRCRFCNVKTGKPSIINQEEPKLIASMACNLDHVVITSVTRDDLKDGGASHFASCIYEIRKLSPNTTIEILTPDFRNKDNALDIIIKAKPDVFNHNIETVPRLHKDIKPGFNYNHSLSLLNKIKDLDDNIFVKSGFMVGLGETQDDVLELIYDLYNVNVDFLTIGQYLQPTPKHIVVNRYITPDEFRFYEDQAYQMGFKLVASGPLVRSSYHAGKYFKILQERK